MKVPSDFQRVKPLGAVFLNLIVGAFAVACAFPFLFVISISFTENSALATDGYRLIPKAFSLEAYSYVFQTGEQLGRSFLLTVFVTIVGTVGAVLVNGMYAYALARKTYRFRRQLSFIAFFTMLFSGGLVPYYIVCTQVMHINNTIFALILPLLVNAYWILILRTFFQTQVPDSIVESAKMDGAGEFTTFFRVVFPLALPGLATIALFACLGYWNDWWNGMLFIIDSPELTPLQYMLIMIERNMEFLLNNASQITGDQKMAIYQTMPLESVRMAMIVLVTVPIVMAYPFFQRFFIRGLTIGAVKG